MPVWKDLAPVKGSDRQPKGLDSVHVPAGNGNTTRVVACAGGSGGVVGEPVGADGDGDPGSGWVRVLRMASATGW